MKDESGKIVFDQEEQAEVDRIVQDRLARAKKEVPEDYNDLKEIDKILEDFDYTGMTAAEKKALLKAQAEEYKKNKAASEKQKEIDDLQDEADKYGSSPELLKELKDLKTELADIKAERQAKKTEEDNKKKADEDWNKQVEEFSEKHEDIDLAELQNNAKFMKFAKGRTGSLTQIYDDYIDLVGEAEAETIAKVKSKQERSTSSGKGSGLEGAHGLTSEQMKNLEDWNSRYPHLAMSAKEYKQSL